MFGNLSRRCKKNDESKYAKVSQKARKQGETDTGTAAVGGAAPGPRWGSRGARPPHRPGRNPRAHAPTYLLTTYRSPC